LRNNRPRSQQIDAIELGEFAAHVIDIEAFAPKLASG
jgi:hypothetical protein